MASVKIQYLRDSQNLYEGGIRPATQGAAGMDLRACMEDEIIILPGERAKVPSGIAIEPCAENVAGFVYSRSGLGAVKGLTVAQGVGLIDPDYRGEIIIFLLNTSKDTLKVNRGERVAQLVFQAYFVLEPITSENLSESDRGSGGFGHTGSK